MLQPFVLGVGFLATPQEGSMRRYLSILGMAIVAAGLTGPAAAPDKPRYGGELVFAVPSEPPSYDAHREETFGVIHPVAPHYNALLRPDPTHKLAIKIVGDLGESWTISKDGRTYTIKLRHGVKFHDGGEMTSKDVKASYEKIIFPPAGVASDRKGEYLDVEAVQAPDPYTVVFRLKWPSGSFLMSLASPWNWIYKADILAKDMRWYETHVMGTGPFVFVKEVAGVQVPGTPFATPPAELEKLAGYGRDIAKSRAEAKRLLKEAGVPDGFAFTFKNRGIPMPYEPVGVWLIDQWRQVGLNVKQEVIEAAKYYAELRGGNFDVAMDFQCGYIVEPDLDLYKFQSKDKSPANYSRYTDPVLDELYEKQGKAVDAEERKKYIRELERRLVDEEAHYLYTLQWNRIIPHSSKVKGWTITPSHYLNQQLDTVWLAE